MKITDSPGRDAGEPFSATAARERVRAVVHLPAGDVHGAGAGIGHLEPVGGIGLLPLPQGATSEMTRDGPAAVLQHIGDRQGVKSALASGVPPTVGSSTSTVTL